MNADQIKELKAQAALYLNKQIEVDSYAADAKTIIRRNYFKFVEIFPPIAVKSPPTDHIENLEIYGYLISVDNENDTWKFKLSTIIDAFKKDSFLDSRTAD